MKSQLVDTGVINTTVVSGVDPANLMSNCLPAMFYGYGTSFETDAFNPGTEFIGETQTIVLNVVLERNKDAGDKKLIDSAATMHDDVRQACRAFLLDEQDTDWGIIEVRVNVDPLTQGLSDREFMQFSIEIDWYYPE